MYLPATGVPPTTAEPPQSTHPPGSSTSTAPPGASSLSPGPSKVSYIALGPLRLHFSFTSQQLRHCNLLKLLCMPAGVVAGR